MRGILTSRSTRLSGEASSAFCTMLQCGEAPVSFLDLFFPSPQVACLSTLLRSVELRQDGKDTDTTRSVRYRTTEAFVSSSSSASASLLLGSRVVVVVDGYDQGLRRSNLVLVTVREKRRVQTQQGKEERKRRKRTNEHQLLACVNTFSAIEQAPAKSSSWRARAAGVMQVSQPSRQDTRV